jgi:hypothetical protein
VVRAVSGPRECCTDRRNCGQDPGDETMNDQVKLDEIAPALSAKEAENMITTNLPGNGQVFSGPVVMAVDRESRNLAAPLGVTIAPLSDDPVVSLPILAA